MCVKSSLQVMSKNKYKFSNRSLQNLATCHIDLQLIFREVIKHIDCSVLFGYRCEEDQNKAFVEEKSKLQWPKSKHNNKPSLAIDVAPYPIKWTDRDRFMYFGGFVCGIADMLKLTHIITHSVRWGGDWDGDNDFKDQRFNDLVHFELL